MQKKHSLPIAQVIRRFSFNEWGGTENVVWNTSLAMAKQGVESRLLTTAALDTGGIEHREGVQIERFSYHYPHWYLSLDKRKQLDKKGGNPYSLGLTKRLLMGKYRLIHCHCMQRIAATVRLAARYQKIPYVMSLHGGQFQVPKNEIETMLLPLRNTVNYGRLLDLGLKPQSAMKHASGIICVGYDEYLVAKQVFCNKPVAYLPNGVDVNRFETQTNIDVCEHFSIPKERKILLSVSRIDSQKNQMLLLKLMLRMHAAGQSNLHLLLVGPVTQPEYLEKLKLFIFKNRLQAFVTIIPGLNPEDPLLPALYQQSHCFVLPSIHEPFGMVVLEAWCAGLPVVASRVGGLSHLVEHGVNGLTFPVNELDALQVLVQQVLTQQSLVRALTTQAALKVREQYSWNSVVERLMDFYRTVEDWYYSARPISLESSME